MASEADQDGVSLMSMSEDPADDNIIYDETYTVTELKAAARGAGITGYSSMTKAELIAALNA